MATRLYATRARGVRAGSVRECCSWCRRVTGHDVLTRDDGSQATTSEVVVCRVCGSVSTIPR